MGDDLNLPAAVLSLEIRQLSALHYVIVVEVTNEYNAEAVATYIDELVNSNGVIYNYLIHHATESSPVIFSTFFVSLFSVISPVYILFGIGF